MTHNIVRQRWFIDGDWKRGYLAGPRCRELLINWQRSTPHFTHPLDPRKFWVLGWLIPSMSFLSLGITPHASNNSTEIGHECMVVHGSIKQIRWVILIHLAQWPRKYGLKIDIHLYCAAWLLWCVVWSLKNPEGWSFWCCIQLLYRATGVIQRYIVLLESSLRACWVQHA